MNCKRVRSPQMPLYTLSASHLHDSTDAAAVYIGFAVLAIVWYLTWGKSHFRGPPELAQIM
jgi:hypothetical protein